MNHQEAARQPQHDAEVLQKTEAVGRLLLVLVLLGLDLLRPLADEAVQRAALAEVHHDAVLGPGDEVLDDVHEVLALRQAAQRLHLLSRATCNPYIFSHIYMYMNIYIYICV